jgi:queuine tRNA-ribosyltransferase
MSFKFQIDHQAKDSQARAGTLEVNGNIIETPIFMPVGTQATVKALSAQDLVEIGAQIILANTYHLYLRPGAQLIASLGGLHNFTGWKKPFMTDSGGFQVFSLGYGIEHKVGKIANIFPNEKGGILSSSAEQTLELSKNSNSKVAGTRHDESSTTLAQDKKLAHIDEEGVNFKSHLDGSKHRFTPESSIQIQHQLGADIILAFDECASPLHDYDYNLKSLERTHRWERQSLQKHQALESAKINSSDSLSSPHHTHQYPHPQYLFGIPHGSEYQDLRVQSARYIASLDFDGFSIGGSLGKSKSDMHRILDWTIPELGPDRPRHLLGIGDIEDLFECVARGIDMFDCVAPSRIARNGALFISPESGGHKSNKFRLIITNSEFKNDSRPIDPSCNCKVCQNHSRAYLNHLFKAHELLAYHLATYHNIYFMLHLSRQIRSAILDNTFAKLKFTWLNP